jgi:DNA-binding IclR family transcriptional regulator
MRNERPGYPLESVDNALNLVWLLRERGQIRVSEAAAALGTSRSTAHRLLAMLAYHGFAQQDPSSKAYAVGPALGSIDVRALARPALERLCQEVEETVHLVSLRGAAAVFLDSVETSRGLRVGSRAGSLMPAHCTAAGKAILAQLPADELRRLYRDERLEQMTPRSLVSSKELDGELERIRRRGFATNLGESEPDVGAVAVAAPGGISGRRLAITVSAPITRLERAGVKRIARAAAAAAADLGRAPSAKP